MATERQIKLKIELLKVAAHDIASTTLDELFSEILNNINELKEGPEPKAESLEPN